MSPSDPARGPLSSPGCTGRVLGRARSRRNDPKDFVCFCQGISRQEIVDGIDKGAVTLEDIQNDLGATVGPCGGSCTPNVVKLLADTLARKNGGTNGSGEACVPGPGVQEPCVQQPCAQDTCKPESASPSPDASMAGKPSNSGDR